MDKRYDAVGRRLLRRHPSDWLPLFGLDRCLPVRVADSNVSTVTAEADVVLLVDGPDPGVLHLEIQTYPDPDLPRRLFLYNCLLAAQHDRPVCSAVVLLRTRADSPAMRGPYERSWPAGMCSVTLHFPVVRVWELRVEDMLAASGTAPLAPLSGAVTESNLAEVIHRVEEVFDRDAPSEAGDLWAMTDILMGLKFDAALISRLMKGNRNMRESTTYQAILEEGRIEALRKMVLRLATRRFGAPDAVTRACVEALSEEARLELMLDRVLDAASWDDLLAAQP
jgi:hypothetical protein